MNITQIAIRYNRVTAVAVFALLLAGVSAYFALPKSQDPGFTIRTATVTTFFPGANPERVELLVTDKLEEEILEMPEIDSITSESRTGISIINANFSESYSEMQPIFDKLRRKVEDAQPDLPSSAAISIVNDEFGDTFGHVYSLTGDGYTPRQMRDSALFIKDRLLKLKEVAKVELYGDREEVIYIEYNNARLSELGLSPSQLKESLNSLNVLSSGGELLFYPDRLILEPTGNFESVEALQNAFINIPSATGLVRLSEIASVYRAYEEPLRASVRSDGKDAISIGISMREGGNILELGKQVQALTAELQQDLPLGLDLKPMFLQSDLTDKSVTDFVSNLIQAVAIVIAVMIITLGIRTGIVVALLIPVTMISTFFVMARFDIGIDQISLAALIIALGLLVDNAIVVVEATIVRREKGATPIDACVAAAKEMAVPLLVSSLTTAAAFTPIALAESAASEFTSAIFYVVTIALLLSWVFSMTFVPMMTPFIKVKASVGESKQPSQLSKSYQLYKSILILSLKNRVIFGSLVIGLFALAILGMQHVPKVFIPPSEDPILSVAIELPTGTSIERSQDMVLELEAFLETLLVDGNDSAEAIGITGWTTYTGTGGPRFVLGFDPPSPNEANTGMVLNVNNSASLDPMKLALEQYMFEQQPDAQLQVKRLSNGPPVSYPIELRVSGPDYRELSLLSSKIKEKLWSLDGVSDVKDTWGLQGKKLVIQIDQARASLAGITSEDIASALNTSVSGNELTEYREASDIIPVVLRTETADRLDIARLENTAIFSKSTGQSVPLSQVANITMAWEPALVERRDRERTITIQVQLVNGVTASQINAILMPWLQGEALTWANGYEYAQGGEAETSGNANAPIMAAIPFALLFIILLLMTQFNSFRRTIIVMVTIPLGLIGVVGGLLIANSTFGFFTFLGIVSLAGIVINNAIVLLDRVKQEIEENGLVPQQAVIEACLQRVRPILLTTATTVGGMLPLWLGGGPMFESLAIAILFGLLFATVITLLLVPVLYSALFRLKYEGYQAIG